MCLGEACVGAWCRELEGTSGVEGAFFVVVLWLTITTAAAICDMLRHRVTPRDIATLMIKLNQQSDVMSILQGDCAICLETVTVARVLPCAHAFHVGYVGKVSAIWR